MISSDSSVRSKLQRHSTAAVVAGLIAGLTPPPVLTVSAWAAAKRYVAAESGSPFPGKWSNDLVPYMVEPMDCLSFDDPCRSVTIIKSAQVAGTSPCCNGNKLHFASTPRHFASVSIKCVSSTGWLLPML